MSTPLPEAHPTEILMTVIVSCLARMFLSATGGDIALARIAALASVEEYRTRSHADLIAIAQIVGCGVAALGSLSLSMAEDIPIPLALRLRSNAVALNRAAEQNRRALGQQPKPDQPAAAPIHTAEIDEAAIIAGVAEAQRATAEAQIRLGLIPPPAAQPITEPATALVPPEAPDAPPAAAQPTAAPPNPAAQSQAQPAAAQPTDQEVQAMWAAAMTDVAAEFAAELDTLTGEERWKATRRIATLTTAANDLLTGNVSRHPERGVVRR